MNAEEILKKALEMEKEAIREYTEMKKDSDQETSELLDFMIEEEKNHVKMINERLKALRLLKK